MRAQETEAAADLCTTRGPHSFFFSSRRRHTRYIGDWSSDECSSDLVAELAIGWVVAVSEQTTLQNQCKQRSYCGGIDHGESEQDVPDQDDRVGGIALEEADVVRSEERRVGKEGRCQWAEGQLTKSKW